MRSSEIRRPINSPVRPIVETRPAPSYPIIQRPVIEMPVAHNYPVMDGNALAAQPAVEAPRRKYMKQPLAFRALDTYLEGLRSRMKKGERFDPLRLKEFANELVEYADAIDQIAQQCQPGN